MNAEALLIWLVIGAVAGWLAGVVMRGGGYGLIGDIVVGILGSVIFGWLFGAAGLSIAPGILGSIIAATIGAIILIFVLRLFTRIA